MNNNFEAHSAASNNEEINENVDNNLMVASTAHIATQDALYGLNGISKEDIKMPEVKLLHAMNPEVAEGIDVAGNFYNTSGISYGSSLIFTVTARWKSRILFGENLDGEIICQSPNSFFSVDGHQCAVDCPHNATQWGDNRTPPRCAECHNFLILPDQEQFPARIRFKKSGIPTAQTLNGLLFAAGHPMWRWKYQLISVKKNGSRGAYYMPTVKKFIDEDGKPVESDPETQKTAENFYYMMTSGKVNLEEAEGSNGAEYNDEALPF